MLLATTIVKHWIGPPIDEIVLDHDDRRRRRGVLKARRGTQFLLDLADTPNMQEGDGILLPDGIVRVRAADEDIMEIVSSDPVLLARIAWHLGNRHMPMEIGAGRLRIRADHVVVPLVQHLGGEIRAIKGPFQPEPGAYASNHNGMNHG